MSESKEDIVLRALDLVGRALAAESVDAAIEELRPDVDVLAREDLVRLALALAAYVPGHVMPLEWRARLAQRVEILRLEVGWTQS